MHGNIQLTCARGAGASGGRVQLATLRRPLVSAPEALLRVRLEVRVLERLGRAPPPALEVLLPGRVLLEDAVVAVVRVADAELVGRALLDAVGGVRVLVALAVRAGVVPEDEVQPLAGGDVVGPVALAPEVAYAAALDVLVGVGVLPVVRRAHEAAELQAGAGEVQPQADVEGHVGVVRVHVEPQILALAVAHDEAVVPVPDAAGAGPEELPQRLQRLLELVYEGLEADLVQDDAVVVHAVRPPRGQAARVEVEDLRHELVAELVREEREGENLPRQLLLQDASPGLRRVLLARAPERGVEPLLAPRRRDLEELLVEDLLGVLADGAEALLVHPLVRQDGVAQALGRGLRGDAPGLQGVHEELVHRLQHQADRQRAALVPRQRAVEGQQHAVAVVHERVVDDALEADRRRLHGPEGVEAQADLEGEVVGLGRLGLGLSDLRPLHLLGQGLGVGRGLAGRAFHLAGAAAGHRHNEVPRAFARGLLQLPVVVAQQDRHLQGADAADVRRRVQAQSLQLRLQLLQAEGHVLPLLFRLCAALVLGLGGARALVGGRPSGLQPGAD
mmetsp:Transcript_9676/g.30010  ORF Transcript_9676/g.30010 Transcript_9676/m.30010 type:complete len:561 (-) Transcript_9676:7-1689(-)